MFRFSYSISGIFFQNETKTFPYQFEHFELEFLVLAIQRKIELWFSNRKTALFIQKISSNCLRRTSWSWSSNVFASGKIRDSKMVIYWSN